MIQRCPECSRWCAADGKNFLSRGWEGMVEQVFDLANFGEKYLGKLGKRAGQIVGGYSSVNRGIIEAIFGYKYQFKCECGCCWGTDDADADETQYYKHECHVVELSEKFSDVNTDDENEWIEYYKELQNALDCDYNTDITHSIICDVSAALLISASLDLEDKEEYLEHALAKINTSLELFDDDNSHITKGLIYALSNNYSYYDALKELIYCKEKEEHPYFSMKSIYGMYNRMCEGYEECFLEIPKEQRKFLVLVSDYVVVPDSFRVLRIGNLPQGMDFLGANLTENILYILHPLKDNTYIPYNEYSIELFREQLYEYRYIMECLGVKSFVVSDLYRHDSQTSEAKRFNVSGSGEYKGYAASGKYASDKNSDKYVKLYNELSQELHCELSKMPFVPEDVIWYHRNVDWKRNCDSRIAGRMLVFKQRLSNKISTGLTTQDSVNIEAEFKSMVCKLNGCYESDVKFSVEEDKEHVWEIAVEFYPMNEYKKVETQLAEPVQTSAFLSANEQKYLATVKEYLEADGEITPKERRLLETLCEGLGIPVARAKELEDLMVVAKPKSSKHPWWKKFFE